MFLDNQQFEGFQLGGAPGGAPQLGAPHLGLREGEEREECPPGMVKAYLPEWPWHECIPEDEAMEPSDVGPPALEPDELEPPGFPEEPTPLEPSEPRPPGKARFLKVDDQTGEILDPNTNQPIESLYAMDTVSTVTTVAVGAGILTAILFGLGVFK